MGLTVRQSFERYRIIKILRVNRINGNRQPVGEILPAFRNFFFETRADLPRFLEDILGKNVRQTQRADNR